MITFNRFILSSMGTTRGHLIPATGNGPIKLLTAPVFTEEYAKALGQLHTKKVLRLSSMESISDLMISNINICRATSRGVLSSSSSRILHSSSASKSSARHQFRSKKGVAGLPSDKKSMPDLMMTRCNYRARSTPL